jgi:thiol-disulfide isomerase/thioredoxin
MKNILIGIIAIFLIVAAAGIYRFNFTNDDISVIDSSGKIMKYDEAMKQKNNAMMKVDDKKIEPSNDSMMKKEESPKMENAMKSHGYMDYSSELASSAMKSGQTVVLFFAASWCPSCKALDKTIQADLGSIPADTLVLKVDYDNSTDLKKQYGVVTQHTTVVLNTDGTLKSKKIGAQRVSEVLGN